MLKVSKDERGFTNFEMTYPDGVELNLESLEAEEPS